MKPNKEIKIRNDNYAWNIISELMDCSNSIKQVMIYHRTCLDKEDIIKLREILDEVREKILIELKQ